MDFPFSFSLFSSYLVFFSFLFFSFFYLRLTLKDHSLFKSKPPLSGTPDKTLISSDLLVFFPIGSDKTRYLFSYFLFFLFCFVFEKRKVKIMNREKEREKEADR